MSGSPSRYAIYFAPDEDSPLNAFGGLWLSPEDRQPPSWVSDPDLWAEATASPARYGFHATLKAPFYLADGRTEGQLLEAVKNTASKQKPFVTPPIVLSDLGKYLALTFEAESPEMSCLHRDCLIELESFRAPLTQADRERRLDSGLSNRQSELLEEYGYPYVLDQFEFHMTLAGPIDPVELGLIKDSLTENADGALYSRLLISNICIYFQRDRESSFSLLHRFEFGKSAPDLS